MMGVLPALVLGLAASSSPYECTYLTPHDKVPTRVHRYNGSMLVSWSPLPHPTPVATDSDCSAMPGLGSTQPRCTEWTG